jgi:chemotaxis protein methyltransferase CheR
VLHDPACMNRLLADLSINVTALFRDPTFFAAFREKAVPLLRTYPFIRIWAAGCASGEEAYSLAILLLEEGLYDRTRIYATDTNETVLARARAGQFRADRLPEYERNHERAGGSRPLADYVHVDAGSASFLPEVSEHIVFAEHDLVTDRSFNEFHVIFCRNVMIYFSRALQDDVHRLFYDSLARFGVLALGRRESLRFTPFEGSYETLDVSEKLYRKVA